MKLLFGLVATAAAYYFLKTEKGRELAETFKKEANTLGENLFAKGGELLKKGNLLIKDVSDKAKGAY